MAALYKMFYCQGGLNWIYGECTVKNVLLSRWFDLVRHGYGTFSFTLLAKFLIGKVLFKKFSCW